MPEDLGVLTVCNYLAALAEEHIHFSCVVCGWDLISNCFSVLECLALLLLLLLQVVARR
jgi:hypothetical protein